MSGDPRDLVSLERRLNGVGLDVLRGDPRLRDTKSLGRTLNKMNLSFKTNRGFMYKD
jgi:hypothetical protein